jgi:hypothetical protein
LGGHGRTPKGERPWRVVHLQVQAEAAAAAERHTREAEEAAERHRREMEAAAATAVEQATAAAAAAGAAAVARDAAEEDLLARQV